MEAQIRLLTADEFRATFGPKMLDITGEEHIYAPDGVINVEPYFNAVPAGHFLPHARPPFTVSRVCRGSDGRFDHVLVPTPTPNAFLVIVVLLQPNRIYGHHLLDLNVLYGLSSPVPSNRP